MPRYKTNEQIEREKRHHDEYEEKMQSGYRQLMIKLRGKSRMELEDYFREQVRHESLQIHCRSQHHWHIWPALSAMLCRFRVFRTLTTLAPSTQPSSKSSSLTTASSFQQMKSPMLR